MTEGRPILKVNGLSKKFYVDPRLGRKPGYKDLIRLMLGLQIKSESLRENEFYALRDVSFELHRGEALGIMGLNGAGKSTLLKVLLGRLPPDSGGYDIRGSVGGLVELSAGFHREMTGLENIYNKGRLLGKSDQEVKAKLDKIIDFADLGDFINSPVKTYSSGMNVRLGFSIAIHFVDDLVLCDEVLAVGDFDFRQKCLGKINQLRKVKSFVLVSHSNGDIATFCDSAIILHKGEIVFQGTPSEAIEAYAQCTHHLSSREIKSRISQSLSLKMIGSQSERRKNLPPSRQFFFRNVNFEEGIFAWISTNPQFELEKTDTGANLKVVNGAVSIKQEIDRDCLIRLVGEINVKAGKFSLYGREAGKSRLIKSWESGSQELIDISFTTSVLEFHLKNSENNQEGATVGISGLVVEHDVEPSSIIEKKSDLGDSVKLSIFGPEFNNTEVINYVSIDWNLRKRDQGYYYVSGDYFVLKIKYGLKRSVSRLRIGIPFFREDGQMILGPDSRNYSAKDELKEAGNHELYMVIDPLPVNVGRFWFTFTLCEDPAHLFRKHITYFDVINPTHEYGLIKTFPLWLEKWQMENSNPIYLLS